MKTIIIFSAILFLGIQSEILSQQYITPQQLGLHIHKGNIDKSKMSSKMKDTVVIDGETELLMRFTQPAGDRTPFMYHCHILEHEDGGMMGQFTVT